MDNIINTVDMSKKPELTILESYTGSDKTYTVTQKHDYCSVSVTIIRNGSNDFNGQFLINGNEVDVSVQPIKYSTSAIGVVYGTLPLSLSVGDIITFNYAPSLNHMAVLNIIDIIY